MPTLLQICCIGLEELGATILSGLKLFFFFFFWVLTHTIFLTKIIVDMWEMKSSPLFDDTKLYQLS